MVSGMGEPITGLWAANNADAPQFAGALKWGTGNNPIHSIQTEGPPLRSTGRVPGPEEAEFNVSDFPSEFLSEDLFGYSMEDMKVQNYLPGYPPPWGDETEVIRGQVNTELPSWGPTLPSGGTAFRTIKEGANMHRHTVIGYPTETVTEGWDNKLTGEVNDAEVSSQTQYERQTSMQQVNPPEGRNNSAAMERGTDDPRDNIMTRLTGVKLKPWSDSPERREDMFPYQQDTIIRPFWYRTAATDNPEKMTPNEMYVVNPVQREVPADPYQGPQETGVDQYGYSGEDVIPYA